MLPHILPIYCLLPNSLIIYQSDHLETWRMPTSGRMQRGYMSSLQSEVRYGRNEPVLIRFHQRRQAAIDAT